MSPPHLSLPIAQYHSSSAAVGGGGSAFSSPIRTHKTICSLRPIWPLPLAAERVVSTKLYFGNLPFNVDSSQLTAMIHHFATPDLVQLFPDNPTPEAPLYPETEHKLFIANLSRAVTAESLRELFEKHGEVVGARVLYDGKTGKPRGFGFVCYAAQAQMEAAIEALDRVVLKGRPIRVSLAQGRQPVFGYSAFTMDTITGISEARPSRPSCVREGFSQYSKADTEYGSNCV